MTRDQILEVCRRAPSVGKVSHEEFADYVVGLQQRKRGEDGWTTVEHPYMTVDGKLAMANEDHRRQAKRLDFGPPQVLVDNEEQLTLMVTVTSEVYGVRHGIATSRRIGGAQAEREFPWEVAETSAIGRALAAMGYGLFPGSGLASAEDMLRVTGAERRLMDRAESSRIEGSRTEGAPRPVAPAPQTSGLSGPASRAQLLSAVQRRKLVDLWRNLHGGSEAEAVRDLDALFFQAFKHGMSQATYEEGSRITGQLLGELRNAPQN